MSDEKLQEMFDKLYTSMNANPDACDRASDELDYIRTKDEDCPIDSFTFSNAPNALLLTDHSYGYAKGFQEYLQKTSDITVDLINNFDDAQKIIDEKPIDFLVIIRYLKTERNYEIIKAVRKCNKDVWVIMLDCLDDFVDNVCHCNDIEIKYEIFRPIKEIVTYMWLKDNQKRYYDPQ